MNPFIKFPALSFQEVEISTNLKKVLKEEEQILEKFKSKKRQLEFRAGRTAAHLALKQFELESFPLLREDKGNVIWPKHFTGSISHSNDLAVAVVCKKEDFSAIGIDVEYLKKDINDSIFKKILNKAEYPSALEEDKIIFFSAKEAIYKAVYSKTKVSLGWKDIELSRNDAGKLIANINKNSINIENQEIFENRNKDYIYTLALLN